MRPAVEILEDRLLPAWGSVPPAVINVPKSGVVVALDADGNASGTAVIHRRENHFYSLIAPRTGVYQIATSTPTSNLDTVLAVYNRNGRRLAYNDDVIPGMDLSSRVSITLQAGRRYYFGVTKFIGTPPGSYSWSVSGPAPLPPGADDRYEDNDTFATAYDLGTLSSRHTITDLRMLDSGDWFRFNTIGVGSDTNFVQIQFDARLGDLDLKLYDADAVPVGSSTGVTGVEYISLSGLPAGTYYVQVFGFNGDTHPNYTLDINPPDGSPPPPSASSFRIELSFSGLTASQQVIFQQAAARWSQVIVGDLPAVLYGGRLVDDLLIDARARPIDGPGGILGQAGPDHFRAGSGLPYHGIMEFDTADLAQMQRSGLLYSVILHEMGHVLGIGTLWRSRGLLVGAGTNNPRYIGAHAVAEFNRIFSNTKTSVPVENTGGPGTRNSHWRETIFGNELMTGYAGPGTFLPLSRITVASLADLGYEVNLAAADLYLPWVFSHTVHAGSTGTARGRAALVVAGPNGAEGRTSLVVALPGRPAAATPGTVAAPQAVAVRLPAEPAAADEPAELVPTGRGLADVADVLPFWEALGAELTALLAEG